MVSSDPIKPTEVNRLKALYEYDILDSAPESQFDAITRLVSYICRTPAALITFADKDRLWIKSKAGSETSLNVSLCLETIKGDDILEIRDLSADKRFPMLKSYKGEARFYAGCPLITRDGYKIGALCVYDNVPGSLDANQRDSLKVLASEVMSHLEVRKKNAELRNMLAEAKRFQELFNNSAELHCITDADGRIEYVNASVLHLLGYPPEEMIGRRVWEFATEGERERLLPEIEAAVKVGETKLQVETTVMRKDGTLRWFEWSDTIMNGRWLINGRDITERKETERRIQDLSFALRKSPAGVIIRNSVNEITWMNEAAEKIIGYELPELQGKIFGDMLVGEKTDAVALEHAKRALKERRPYELELVIYRKGGLPIWIFISNNPLFNSEGEIESQVAIIVDITIRKQAEEQMIKARQEAIELGKAKEVLLSVMSHEIRTPLNAIIGISRILKQENPSEHQKENLGILEFSANNLLALINDVLDFTKVETGNMQLESKPFDIRKLAIKTIESLRFRSQDKEVKLICEVDPGIPRQVFGDSTRLYQIFMNLLGNALKFTDRGQVSLILSIEEEDAESVSVHFSVSDTGIGIPEDKISKIFDAYSQAEIDTSSKYGGTGLGLAITRKLLELHNSEITVKSSPGKGSVFSFTVRFLKVNNIEEEMPQPAMPEVPISATALVVDDNAVNRLLARKVLSNWGIKTDFAENGREAIDKVKAMDYDIVFMDIEMPVMGGVDAVRHIRSLAEDKYRQLPVIALTASAQKQDENKYLEAGMDDFVLKPFDPGDLYRKIRKVLKSD